MEIECKPTEGGDTLQREAWEEEEERHTKTSKDIERHTKTHKDIERHRKTHKDIDLKGTKFENDSHWHVVEEGVMVLDISQLMQARRVGEKEHQPLIKLVACNKRASTACNTPCLHVFVPICMCALFLGFVGASVC